MRTYHGWIYREPASGVTPARIRVKLNQLETQVFNDNHIGAEKAAEYISRTIGYSWKLEDMQFLGYRIITE